MLINSYLAEHVGEIILCLATQAGKMELLPANEKRNFFVSSESWNIVNTGKIYHLLNFFLFSTPFVLFFLLYDFVEFRVQLLPHSLQLPVPRSHTSRTFAALCFPTSALFSYYSRPQFDKKDYWFNKLFSHHVKFLLLAVSHMKADSNKWFISLHVHCWTVCVFERSV